MLSTQAEDRLLDTFPAGERPSRSSLHNRNSASPLLSVGFFWVEVRQHLGSLRSWWQTVMEHTLLHLSITVNTGVICVFAVVHVLPVAKLFFYKV